MNERRATKRALLTSITALVMCVVMLAGTTFAWFTDTASTNVNKIQAGNLDVALEMYDTTQRSWINAEGKTLNWVKDANAPVGQATLWEPGATYELPKLKVVNNGNLNIKCRVEVTGIKKVTTAATPAGTFDLNDAITWSATGLTLDKNFTLDTASNKEKEFTISGTMKTTAGNDYQGLSIDGVSITVYATQAEGEFDSNRDDYDKDATYTRTNATLISETYGKTVTLEAGKTYTVGTASITTDASGNIAYENSGTPGQKVTINTDGHNLTVNAPNDTVYHYGKAGTVTVTAVAGNSYHEFGDASVLAIAKGRAVIEKSDAVKVLQVMGSEAIIAVPQNIVVNTKLEKDAGVSEIVIKTVDSSDQVVTVTTIESGSESGSERGSATTTKDDKIVATPKELSKIINNGSTTIGNAEDYVAMIGSTGYTTLPAAVTAAEGGDTITLLRDVELSEAITIGKAVTLDLNGHTITNSLNSNGYSLVTKAAATIVNGTYKGTGTARGIGAYGNLTMRNVTVDVAGLVGVACSAADSQYTIEDSTIKGGYALCNFNNNATINVSNSTLEGESVGLYHNGSNFGLNLTVTGTKINADNNGTDATGVYISGSTTTKEAAGYQKASFTDCTVKGNAAIEVKYTNLTLNNCTVTATVPAANASYKQNNNGSTTNGFAVVSTDNAINNTMPKPEGTITINGGSYTGLIGLHNFSGIQTNFPGFVDATYVINP
mgnify:FL=1